MNICHKNHPEKKKKLQNSVLVYQFDKKIKSIFNFIFNIYNIQIHDFKLLHNNFSSSVSLKQNLFESK